MYAALSAWINKIGCNDGPGIAQMMCGPVQAGLFEDLGQPAAQTAADLPQAVAAHGLRHRERYARAIAHLWLEGRRRGRGRLRRAGHCHSAATGP